eukprot:scaffold104380_cov48-Phaeocystis_antarctica.AAC.1
MHTLPTVNTGPRVEEHARQRAREVVAEIHRATVLIVRKLSDANPGQPKRARSRLAFGRRVDHRGGAAAVTRGATLQNHRAGRRGRRRRRRGRGRRLRGRGRRRRRRRRAWWRRAR